MAIRRRINRQLSENLWLSEVWCRCCHEGEMHPVWIRMFQELRDQMGVPLIVSSGCRCPKHNSAEGGTRESRHLIVLGSEPRLADGGDILTPTTTMAYKLVQKAIKIGFSGIGIGRGFVHLDCRDGPHKLFVSGFSLPKAAYVI